MYEILEMFLDFCTQPFSIMEQKVMFLEIIQEQF